MQAHFLPLVSALPHQLPGRRSAVRIRIQHPLDQRDQFVRIPSSYPAVRKTLPPNNLPQLQKEVLATVAAEHHDAAQRPNVRLKAVRKVVVPDL